MVRASSIIYSSKLIWVLKKSLFHFFSVIRQPSSLPQNFNSFSSRNLFSIKNREVKSRNTTRFVRDFNDEHEERDDGLIKMEEKAE